MEIKVKPYSSQSSLLNSILFFVIGAILFTAADKVIQAVSIGIGIILAVIAVIEFTLFYLSTKKEYIDNKTGDLIFGIVLLILAIIFIFFSSIVEHFIRFIVGSWILFSGIMRLINALTMNNKNTKFIPLLIVSILLIAVGIYTIVIGNIIIQYIGIIMMIYAVIETIGYIFYTKDTKIPEEEGTSTLIVPDEEDKKIEKEKNKKVKTITTKKPKNK